MSAKKRFLSLLLCGVMLLSLCSQAAFAEGVEAGGLCEHHPQHTAECGYTEGSEGAPCGHEHTEDCYTLVTECVHEHGPECYPQESVEPAETEGATDDAAAPIEPEEQEPSACAHVCSEESGCITKTLDCQHEHDETCGYAPAIEGTPCTYVCEICNPQDSGETEDVELGGLTVSGNTGIAEGAFQYGDTITVTFTPERKANTNTNALAENTATLTYTNAEGPAVELATATAQSDGSFELSYDTKEKKLPIGENLPLTVSYGGSGALNPVEKELTVTLEQAILKNMPTVTGSFVYGETLTVNYTKQDDESVTYQWYRGGEKISDATENSYTLTAEDISKNIYVIVSATDEWHRGAMQSRQQEVAKAQGSIEIACDSVTYGETVQPSVTSTTNEGATVTYSYAGTGDTSYGPSNEAPENAGTYTVTATAAETATHTEATSAAMTFTISKASLDAPQNLSLTSKAPGTATATWGTVENASGYTVHLYKGGQADGEPITTTGTSYEFLIAGAGSYTVKVKANGDNNHSDSEEASASLTFYAVTFAPNGGDPISPQAVAEGGRAAAPKEPVWEGHVFAGWYTDSGFAEGSAWDFSTDTVTEETTLYAKWLTDVASLTIAPIPAQTYTGGAIYPAVSVWHGQTKLVMGVDYTVSYQNNVNVGVATVVIAGMGDYTGTRLAFFDIVLPAPDEDKNEQTGNAGGTGNTGSDETTGEAQQNRLVVDTTGAAMPYTYSTVEVLDEETGAVIARKLAIVAGPVRDETGAIVYDANGQPLYEARALLLSRELLDAIAERSYTHIRFMVKDAALEWPLASMPGDNYTVRLAPMEEEEWNEREIAAVEGLSILSQGYRAQIVTVTDGEETDVTKDILDLRVLLLAEAVSPVEEGREESLLLVPLEEMVENSLSPANWVEATEIEPARFETLLIDSGLFAMVGE